MPRAPLPDIDIIWILLSQYGLRISEVLQIQRSDLEAPDVVHVRTKKGGNAREIVSASLYAAIDARVSAAPTARPFAYTYRDVYEATKELGVGYKPQGGTHRRITHAGRAGYVQRRAAEGATDEQIADELGLTTAQVVPLYKTTA